MTSSKSLSDQLGIVIIGRNEGARLERCLQSVTQTGAQVVYVDSGSTDGSVAHAKSVGAQVVALDMQQPFTAARARNEGLTALGLGTATAPHTGKLAFVQFIDGDCEMQPDWLQSGMDFLQAHPDVGVVSGRLRERHPQASPYNALCDAEWAAPAGPASACGGIAMMRLQALAQSGWFNAAMIAGEEPELCVRLTRAGWTIWRLEDEMALHDAAMTRFGQYWKRMRRGGFAFALWADMHGRSPEQLGVAQIKRTVLWAAVIPALILAGVAVVGPVGLLLLLLYPAQIARMARREGGSWPSWRNAGLLSIGKFAEMQGIVEFHWRKWTGRPAGLIEHK